MSLQTTEIESLHFFMLQIHITLIPLIFSNFCCENAAIVVTQLKKKSQDHVLV